MAYSNGNAAASGPLSVDIAPSTDRFPVDNGECDLDRPAEGFASIPEAIEDIRQGKLVLVVDDEEQRRFDIDGEVGYAGSYGFHREARDGHSLCEHDGMSTSVSFCFGRWFEIRDS